MGRRLIVVLAGLVLLHGCQDIETGRSLQEYQSAKRQTEGFLKQKHFAGVIRTERVNVVYDQGFEPQARVISKKISASLAHNQEATGITFSNEKWQVYLVRAEKAPSVKMMTGSFYQSGEKYEVFNLVLYVRTGRESCEEILSNGSGSLPLLFSAGTTYTLSKKYKTPCEKCQPGFSENREYLQTQWFLVGLSNYIGDLGHQDMWAGLHPEKFNIPAIFYQSGLKEHPFSSLDKVRGKLFTWPPCSNLRKVNNIDVSDYQDAAAGLFWVIRDKYGEKAIKDLVLGLKDMKKIDGPALITLVNSRLHTNIEALVDTFHFPRTGMDLGVYCQGTDNNIEKEGLIVNAVQAKSPADTAGIKKGDFIWRVNRQRIKTPLDYEMAIYNAMKQPGVEVTVLRDKSEVVTTLPLTGG